MEQPSLRSEPVPGDREAVRSLLEATAFFHPREIDVAVELIDDRLRKGTRSDYLFLFADFNDTPLGYACYGPITMTDRRFDLYWIAVHPSRQGHGLGRTLLEAAEAHIRSLGGSHLVSETSSRESYRPTRAFYRSGGFTEAARVPDFYADNDDKIIFMKRLSP